MYVSYYSKIRNTLTGNVEDIIAPELNKIVTKVVDCSNWDVNKRHALFLQRRKLQTEVRAWQEAHPGELSQYYQEFHIPKRSGGYRVLHAPEESLKQLQRKILTFLIKDCKLLCHNAVHSFVRNRNCKTAMEVHRNAGARWFLKLDIKDFFDSCEENLVMTALRNIHPLGTVLVHARSMFSVCFLNGKLPQGAPTSPLLSNLYLTNFDYILTEDLKGYTYTRYADDLLISKSSAFQFSDVIAKVQLWLPHRLTIKRDKIRYGSCNGSNWNLGLMYNKDLEITVGYRNKHLVKNKIHNLFTNKPQEHTPEWVEWCQSLVELRGLIGYYTFIEPEYFNNLVARYRDKGYTI